MVNNNYKNRFLKYISFDTQSCDESMTCPSTEKQKELGKYLASELVSLGIDNAYMDNDGYVYGYLKSNCGSNETIGLIAHMDTSDEASGKDVKPVVVNNYDGNKIVLNQELGLVLDPEVFPCLKEAVGHEIIHTDGTTLLGADDKSGIAIIMTAVETLLNGNFNYPNIIVTFTPDEEIGRGTDKFNHQYYKDHNCDMAYTVDGGTISDIECENFNAASAHVVINGKSIHPGSAKDKMVNSQILAMEFFGLLPVGMRPELTQGYEGFNHLTSIKGTTSKTVMDFIIRNHDMDIFKKQKQMFVDITNFMNIKYGDKTVELVLNDSYYNMKQIVDTKKIVLEIAEEALKLNGLNVTYSPIRGGTDGARLCYDGIVTPNLGTGGQNFHGPFEYVDVDDASKMVDVVVTLCNLYTK